MKKRELRRLTAFTLAETLITMAVIGVVAAVTVPALLTNIQERVQKEQLRSAKYKLTLATDKMKSLGLLDARYNSTNSTKLFIDELQKHLKIMKRCDGTNTPLSACWPTSTIALPSESTSSANVNSLENGEAIKALALSTKTTKTEGIVTADGTPMILVYSPNCTPLDAERTYTWSTIDNKPETNATTNCISAIIDVNGKKGPNKLGKDVRTLNSLYGSFEVGANTYGTLSSSECASKKGKLGIKNCYSGDDNWGGAVKYCYDRGLHLPSEQTLAVAAGARYGRSDITPTTVIASEPWVVNQGWEGANCQEKIKKGYNDSGIHAICISASNGATTETMNNDDDNAAILLEDLYWINIEYPDRARMRSFRPNFSGVSKYARSNSTLKALCVGD